MQRIGIPQKPLFILVLLESLDERSSKTRYDAINLKFRPADNDFHELHALLKQATVGNVNTPRSKYIGSTEWDVWHHKWHTHLDRTKQAYISTKFVNYPIKLD